MKSAAAVLCLVSAAAGAQQTGLEYLNPQSKALVRIQGTVRDQLTGAPIAGAHVLVSWTGATYPFSLHPSTNYLCLRKDATRTGADGSFALDAPASTVYRFGLAQQSVDIRTFKEGWEERRELGTDARAKVTQIEDGRWVLLRLVGPEHRGLAFDFRLEATKKDATDRLRQLVTLADRRPDCETTGNAQEAASYFAAVSAEARKLAKTQYQIGLAHVVESGAGASGLSSMPELRSPELTDLERRDGDDMTPLMRAAFTGQLDQVRALLAAGANPNRTLRGDYLGADSALGLAIARYHMARMNKAPAAESYAAIISALLADKRTNPNVRRAEFARTPLITAVDTYEDDLVEWLLAAGADPNLTADSGKEYAIRSAKKAFPTSLSSYTPSLQAERQMQLLLDSKRVDFNFVDGNGFTPLIDALTSGQSDIARRFLLAGANPNACDAMKRTPLLAATTAAVINPTRPQYVDGVRLMASWPGTDHDAVYEGMTALATAVAAKRPDLIAVLKRR